MESGTYRGKRYFHCPAGHGMMVKYKDVTKIQAPQKRPPVQGNPMYPSYSQIREARREKSAR